MDMTSRYVWMNGELVAYENAVLPFLTPALHYGIGVFEGIRCYCTEQGPAVFRLREHMHRLIDSALVLGFRTLPFNADQLGEATLKLVVANGFEQCYIRPLIYLADGGWNLTVDTGKPRVGIAVWKWDSYLGSEALERGVRANTSSFTRHHPNVTMTKAKVCGNYVNSVLGITRDSLITLAREMGYSVVEQPISRDQIYIADEVFVCGTAAEVIALNEVDFRQIGAGCCGAVTRRIQQAFSEAVHGRHKLSRKWLTYVPLKTLPGVPCQSVRPVQAAEEVV